MKKILKGILLYATIIYSLTFMSLIDAIVESGMDILLIIGMWIEAVFLYGCYTIFKKEDLEKYIPKWFK